MKESLEILPFLDIIKVPFNFYFCTIHLIHEFHWSLVSEFTNQKTSWIPLEFGIWIHQSKDYHKRGNNFL